MLLRRILIHFRATRFPIIWRVKAVKDYFAFVVFLTVFGIVLKFLRRGGNGYNSCQTARKWGNF